MSDMRRYECEYYSVMAPPKHCLFCDHCTDVFYDFDGPYMFLCNINADTSRGITGRCERFEEEAE